MRAFLVLIVAAVCGCDQQAINQQLLNQGAQLQDQIEDQVAADAVRQYEMVARNAKKGDTNSQIQLSVQAGFVAAAYLQAEDEANYKAWNDIADRHSKAAGLP